MITLPFGVLVGAIFAVAGAAITVAFAAGGVYVRVGKMAEEIAKALKAVQDVTTSHVVLQTRVEDFISEVKHAIRRPTGDTPRSSPAQR